MKKWPETLLLVRHGQSEANVRKDAAKAAGLEPSWTHDIRDMDTPLTNPVGQTQAFVLGMELARRYPPTETYRFHSVCKGSMIQYIIRSPYLRTKQTTEHIIRGLGYTPKVVVEERIREIDFGSMDGITREQFRELYPNEGARRARDGKYWYRPPGGENRPDVRLRVHSFLDTLNRDYEGTKTLIVCHSVVVLAFRSLLERWEEAEYLQVDKEDDVQNCGLTVYKREDQRRLRLQEYNTMIPTMIEGDEYRYVGQNHR